jgi:hypothetical protein
MSSYRFATVPTPSRRPPPGGRTSPSQNAAVQHGHAPGGYLATFELLPCRLLAVFFALYAVLMIFYSLTTFRALRASPYHAFRTGELCLQCALCGVTQALANF